MNHEPVMLNEVLNILSGNMNLNAGLKFKIVDGTLGAGGYSLGALEKFSDCEIVGIDRDLSAIEIAEQRLEKFSGRFKVLHGNFGNIKNILANEKSINAFMFDLGLSNMQITNSERGFSFMNDGPLDMRMNVDSDLTASDVLEQLDVFELEKIFRAYGEERYSKLIARAIKNFGRKINTTAELVNIIRDALPQPVQRKMGTHPARRIFQALRIYVNDEAGELTRMLEDLPEFFINDALVIIVSYHSLEDRIVKNTFKKWKANSLGEILTRHPLRPSENEIAKNFKSRSAKLRAFHVTIN